MRRGELALLTPLPLTAFFTARGVPFADWPSSLSFYGVIETNPALTPYFRILIQFPKSKTNGLDGRKTSLHNQKFELQFLAAEDIAEIELPKFSGETKTGPTLVQINNCLQSDCTPKVSQRHVSAHQSQLHVRVERKELAIFDEAIERITVEMIAVRGIGSPIRIRIVWSSNCDAPARLGDSM